MGGVDGGEGWPFLYLPPPPFLSDYMRGGMYNGIFDYSTQVSDAWKQLAQKLEVPVQDFEHKKHGSHVPHGTLLKSVDKRGGDQTQSPSPRPQTQKMGAQGETKQKQRAMPQQATGRSSGKGGGSWHAI